MTESEKMSKNSSYSTYWKMNNLMNYREIIGLEVIKLTINL